MNTTTKTPKETAQNIIGCLSSMFDGAIFALAPSAEETADAIESSPELAARLSRMRQFHNVAEAVCRKAQPILDARAAMHAMDSVYQRPMAIEVAESSENVMHEASKAAFPRVSFFK
jgi:hypothetical protein